MPIEDFRRIVESLKLPVAIADAKGRVVFANGALSQLAVRPVESIEGSLLVEIFAPGDQKRVQQNVERVIQGKSGVSFIDVEVAMKPKSPPLWVQAALQPASDARGKTAGVIAVLRDIGAQRETEDALNLLTARLLAMTDALPVATLVETVPGDVELVNEAFCRLLDLGSAPQSLSGLPVHEVLGRAHRVDRKELERIRANPEESASIAITL